MNKSEFRDPPRIAEFVAHYGDALAFSRKMHVSPEYRFIYVNNPKVACSSTKASLNLAIAERTGREIAYASMSDIHRRKGNPLRTAKQVRGPRFRRMLRNPKVLKFTFVRDPVARFCSAYLSKLDQSKADSGQVRRLWAHMGWDRDETLTIDTFARLCRDDTAVRDLDPHWQLQRTQIAYDLIDFSFIGHHETWSEDFARISRWIFDGEEIPQFDSRTAFGRTTPSKALAREISAETRRVIEEAYAADYDMLADIQAQGLNTTL